MGGNLTAVDITNVIKIEFDCRPGAIAMSLALREPKYQETAAYCHFGRQPYTKDGIKFFEWENAKDLAKYKSMNSSQVEAELKASNCLTKWWTDSMSSLTVGGSCDFFQRLIFRNASGSTCLSGRCDEALS